MILATKLVCPKCGAAFKMQDAANLDIVHEIARLSAILGPRGWPAVELYLTCFQRAVDRPLRPDKFRLLLQEICHFWDQEGFTYDGKEYRIEQGILAQAMRHVGVLEKRGFTNHNYLKKVAIDFQSKANAQEARHEIEHEQRLRARAHAGSGAQRAKEIVNGLREAGL